LNQTILNLTYVPYEKIVRYTCRVNVSYILSGICPLNSLKETAFSEANRSSATQEIPCILLLLKVHSHVHNSLSFAPILSQIKPDFIPSPQCILESGASETQMMDLTGRPETSVNFNHLVPHNNPEVPDSSKSSPHCPMLFLED